MDTQTSKGNSGNNNRCGAVDNQRTSASCLEFEGCLRQIGYEIARNEKLRNAVTVGIIAALIATLLFE